ncbi:MAG TPA: phosphoglucosamine mutase [Spirochaetota bacterium]|nr:phosphoglucosamine mutase [Spirochaetota bacterium]HPR48399.1 phosphoglucosamine mutase [Spirochaetota bacterium]
MATPLMMSVSGIRGVVGETMTPELILRAGSAFARYVKGGTVVIGRDSRPTGEAISRGMQSVLALAGCDVVDIGIVPTPTVQVMVEELGAAGGIVISASHNPIQWNAFKLINRTGAFLTGTEINRYFSMMDMPVQSKPWDRVGTITGNTESHRIHIQKVLSVINRSSIKKKKFTVVLDSVNGAGSVITPELLEQLGCRLIPLFCDPGRPFPRGAEPLPENLKALAAAVKKHGADIGFAQDPDADRLAIVDEHGRPIGEELTVSLATEHLLSKEPGLVVVNLSTTKTVEAIARSHGARFLRAKVGEINVVEEMRKKKARIGGEGNGGVISPEVHLGRDSLVGIGYVLDMMARRKKTISGIVASLPRFAMRKGKVSFDPSAFDSSSLEKIRADFTGEKISDIDGLRIDFVKSGPFKGGWVHLRPSNTEPVFRIIAEGEDSDQADAIYGHFQRIFS